MNIIKFFLPLVMVFSISISLNAQDKILSPINYKMKLSGSFGELRTNHFHTGIDIKSSGNWETNKAICVMNGHISRIKVSADGYGNALYIDHPNGMTSVYAHLYSFNKRIAKFVRDFQYKHKTFEIYPDSLHIPVKKSEIIGQIGNSGRSFGTHLHFELRDTKTEQPINPFKYGIKPTDTRAPILTGLKIVALDPNYNILNSKKYNLKKTKNGNYISLPSNIVYGAWRIGVEIKGYDQMNGAPNKNGIYKITMKSNGVAIYSFILDSLNFENNSDINAHIDYKEFKINKSRYNRLYILPGNDLDIYSTNSKSSIISLYRDESTAIEVIAEDYNGNKSTLNFSIKRNEKIFDSEPKLFNKYLKYGEAYKVENNDYYLNIEKDDLFKDMYLFLSNNNDSLNNTYSNDIRILTDYQVFKNKIDLYIKPFITDSLLDKLCLVKKNKKKYFNLGNKIVNGYFHAKIREGGTFKLMLDTIAPTIKVVSFSNNMSKRKTISFIIKDNFEIGGFAKSISINGYIDGDWVLFVYDKKNNKITHRFNKTLKPGKHHFKLIVKDDRDNETVFEKDFVK